MTATFATQDWAEALAGRLNDDAQVRTDSMTWVFGPILLVVDADPEHGLDATGLRIDVHEGEIRGVAVTGADQVALVPTALGGSLGRWKAVFGGSLAIVDGVREAKLRLKGDLPTLQRHQGLLEGLARAASGLDTRWQDEVPAEAAAATAH